MGILMKDCGVKPGDVINMEPMDIAITIKKTPDGRELPIRANPNDNVRDLKKKIEDVHGIPIENQNLAFEGVPLDDPLETLGDRGVKHGDVVDLLDPLLAVNVKTPDGSITHRFNVKPSNTVQDLKERIENDVNIPVDDQKLVYKGKPLNDPSVTVNNVGISDGDTLHLNCKQKKPSKKAVPDYDGDTNPAKSSKPVRVLNSDSAWVYPTNASAP